MFFEDYKYLKWYNWFLSGYFKLLLNDIHTPKNDINWQFNCKDFIITYSDVNSVLKIWYFTTRCTVINNFVLPVLLFIHLKKLIVIIANDWIMQLLTGRHFDKKDVCFFQTIKGDNYNIYQNASTLNEIRKKKVVKIYINIE